MKSQVLGVILILASGPLGLFYARWQLGLIMTTLTVIFMPRGNGQEYAVLTVWCICWVMSVVSIARRNTRVQLRLAANERQRRELLSTHMYHL